MIAKSLISTLSRLMGLGAVLLASVASGQGFTVNDGSNRGTCSSFTFAGGVLALSPSGCLGTPSGGTPVFSIPATNTQSLGEEYALGVPARVLTLTIHLDRQGNTSPLNVDVEICATGTNCTVVGGLDFLLDGSFPAAPPWKRTLSFAAGDTDKTFDVYLADDLVSDGNKILTYKLSAATSPATIGGTNPGVLTIVDNELPDGQETDINGLPVAHVVIEQFSPINVCGLTGSPGVGTGPCGSSPMQISTCGTGINGGISAAWQINMASDAAGTLTYMPWRFHALHIPLGARHVLSWKFKTPPANQVTQAVFGGFNQSSSTVLPGEGNTFMSVTTTRCDFDYSKVNTFASPNGACYRSLGGSENGVSTRLVPAGTPPDASFCDLQPNTEYYVNMRWENASPASRGNITCNAGACGMAFEIR